MSYIKAIWDLDQVSITTLMWTLLPNISLLLNGSKSKLRTLYKLHRFGTSTRDDLYRDSYKDAPGPGNIISINLIH